MIDIRLLKANEVECRPGIVKEDGCMLLLYKDARVDMAVLDETFGAKNWQRTHEVINGNLFCNIDVWDDEKKTWVRKQDVGVPSETEKEKGEASDAFKRAGFNVGIGRELYTGPFIWIRLKPGEAYAVGKSWKLSNKLKFFVSSISYNENRCIDGLVIVDQTGEVRYKMGETPAPEVDGGDKAEKEDMLTELIKEFNTLKGIVGEEDAFAKLKTTRTQMNNLAKQGTLKDLEGMVKKIKKVQAEL